MRGEPRRIVLRAPNWVGDVIMATPALRALRARFPQARIAVMAKGTGLAVLDGSPWFDDGIERGRGLRENARRLRAFGADAGVLLPNSHGSALEMWLAGVPRRVGTDMNLRGLLLTDRVRPRMAGLRRDPTPMTRYYLDVVALLGAASDDERVELHTTAAGDAKAEAWLAERGVTPDDRVVVVAPGAAFGPSKLWLPERWAAVADRLAAPRGWKILLSTAPDERALGAEVAAHCRAPVVNPDGASVGLRTIKSILARHAAIALTTDSGARHVATGLGIAAVVLMGPTHPGHTASNLERTTVVRQEGIECAPCHLKICPIDHRCMTRIDVDRVARAAEALITAAG